MKINKNNCTEINSPIELFNFLNENTLKIESYINNGLGLDYLKNDCPVSFHKYENAVSILFCGWELILLDDGKYYINDTTGG